MLVDMLRDFTAAGRDAHGEIASGIARREAPAALHANDWARASEIEHDGVHSFDGLLLCADHLEGDDLICRFKMEGNGISGPNYRAHPLG